MFLTCLNFPSCLPTQSGPGVLDYVIDIQSQNSFIVMTTVGLAQLVNNRSIRLQLLLSQSKYTPWCLLHMPRMSSERGCPSCVPKSANSMLAGDRVQMVYVDIFPYATSSAKIPEARDDAMRGGVVWH